MLASWATLKEQYRSMLPFGIRSSRAQSLALVLSSEALASLLIETSRVSGPSPKKITSTVISSLPSLLAANAANSTRSN